MFERAKSFKNILNVLEHFLNLFVILFKTLPSLLFCDIFFINIFVVYI